jgi:hypothetical protein
MPNMTSSTLTLMAIVVVIAAVAVALAWLYRQRHRRIELRERFGPEYDRTVQTVGTTGRAEAVLEERATRVAKYRLRELNAEESRRFAVAWRAIQEKFVDDPAGAVTEADTLVTEVMTARGYPMADWDRRVEDLTVDHANVVHHYRAAREIAARHARHAAGTEELRQALVHHRELFADLLGPLDAARRTA